jgi:hypothetical protein
MPRSWRRWNTVLLLTAAAVLQACGSDDDNGTDPTPSFTIALSQTSATVPQGGSVSFTATITGAGGFTGGQFGLTGAPTGVTVVPGTPQLSGSTTTVPLTINVAASVAPGTYQLTGTASGTGVQSQTVQFTLTVTAVTPGSFVLASAPGSLSLAQGASGTVTVNITRTNFAGAITLAATGLPNGVTVAFNPNNTTTNSSTVTFTASATAATGAATVTITGTGTGVQNQTVPVQLTVTAASTGNYTLSATPAALTVAQGASGTSTINITRTGGFAGAVTLAASGLPNGVTAAFDPNNTTTNSSTLTLTASATAATGAATVTITGSGGGVGNQTTTVALTVNASTGGSGNVTLDYTACTGTQASVKPIWVAVQDGAAGNWTRVTPTNDVYRFNITQAKGGYAAATQNGNNTVVTVSLFAQNEITAAPFVFCTSSAGATKTVNVTVQGAGQTDIVNIGLGGGTAIAIGATLQNPVAIQNVREGTHDLVAYRGGIGGPTLADRAFLIRDVNAPAGTSAGTIDFSGSGAISLASATFTLTGAQPSEQYIAAMQYLTGAACTGGTLWAVPNSGTQLTAFGIPAASQRNTDYHVFLATATAGNVTRVVQETFRVLGQPRQVALGAVPTPTVTALSGAYKRLQATVTLPTEYNLGASLTYSDASFARTALVVPTPGWIGGAQATLAFPDFAGVSGWQDSWMPASGSTVNWSVNAIGGTVSANLCTEGRRSLATSVAGSA